MNYTLATVLSAVTLLALPPARAAEDPVVVIEHRELLAATDEALIQADAWKRWADDFSRDMRASMGTMFAPRMGAGKLVKGAPYSAQVITETNQALADGNMISRKKQGAIYRDAEGRTRQEQPGDGKEPTVFISDPVEGRQYILTPGGKKAISHPLVNFDSGSQFASEVTRDERQVVTVGGREVRVENGKVFVDGKAVKLNKVDMVAGGKAIRVEDGKIYVDGKLVGESGGSGSKVIVSTTDAGDGTRREEIRVQVVRAGDDVVIPMPPLPPRPPHPPGAVAVPIPPVPPLPPMPGVSTFRFESTAKLGKGVTTNLGTKDFDGVKAEGKSTVWTIAAGEIGNRNAINVTSESWYAPELQATVYSRYNDPRTGETVYRLAGIRRGEPPADLFKVPPEYLVKKREREGRNENGNRRSR
ncbi:MAG TPA: hypothetical protein VM073_11795 [Usitatibacter sp.]|nr:hypothetical protein [Usitatibacter sp.]